VTLIRTYRYTRAAGSDPPRGPWQQEAYFVYDVSSGRGRRVQ
jgi:hypothetical protein